MLAQEGKEPAKEPGEPVISINTGLMPFEQRDLHFRAAMAKDAVPGSVYAFDIAEYLGELRIGGYTVLLIAK
jgi:hypothetical protein